MKTCCFIGHRKINKTPELIESLKKTVIDLIKNKGVKTFLFGSKSAFDDLCLHIVTEIKTQFNDITLIYYRSSYPHIDNSYKEYLLKSYDQTIMPKGIEMAGKASYVERNQKMIDKSDFCVFYYDSEYSPPTKKSNRQMIAHIPKSGTKVAYEYAEKRQKEIINLYK